MSRMKTFFKYFLALIIVYFLVNFLSVYLLRSTYKTKEYSIEDSILDIQVTSSQATYVNGQISGVVKNNTDAVVSDKYLKIDSYSKRDVLLGTKYVQLKNLNPGEETQFSSSFNYENIDHINVSVIDSSELPPPGDFDLGFDNPDDAKVTFLVILGAVIVLIPLFPF